MFPSNKQKIQTHQVWSNCGEWVSVLGNVRCRAALNYIIFWNSIWSGENFIFRRFSYSSIDEWPFITERVVSRHKCNRSHRWLIRNWINIICRTNDSTVYAVFTFTLLRQFVYKAVLHCIVLRFVYKAPLGARVCAWKIITQCQLPIALFEIFIHIYSLISCVCSRTLYSILHDIYRHTTHVDR